MQSVKTMSKTKNQLKSDNGKIEICNECGRDVSIKSGLFVNRVIDLDDYQTRKKMNKPFPKGNYIAENVRIK